MDVSSAGSFAKVAPYLSNPLTIAGFALFLLFGLYRALIASRILPRVNARDSSIIVRLILRYGFWIAVIAIIAGFGLAFYRAYNDPLQSKQAKIEQTIQSLDDTIALGNVDTGLEQLRYIAQQNVQDRDYITALLWKILIQIKTVNNDDYRLKRDRFIQYFKEVYDHDLRRVFAFSKGVDGDFAWVDLRDSNMSKVDFSSSFFLDATFERANLSGANLDNTYVAMVGVHDTDFSDTSMTEVDWFNMLGITKEQLQRAKTDTIMDCPGRDGNFTEEQFIKYIDDFYAFGFARWSEDSQKMLKSYWREYSKPDGLCAMVESMH